MTAAKYMRYGLTGTGDTFVVRGDIKHPKGRFRHEYSTMRDYNPKEMEFTSAEEAIEYTRQHNKAHSYHIKNRKQHRRIFTSRASRRSSHTHSYYISPDRGGQWFVSLTPRKNSVARIDPKGKVHELEWLGLRTGGEWEDE